MRTESAGRRSALQSGTTAEADQEPGAGEAHDALEAVEWSARSDADCLARAAGVLRWPRTAEGAPRPAVRAREWIRRSPEELRSELGISRRSAERLAAALEFARRAVRGPRPAAPTIRCARDAFEWCADDMAGLEVEHFRALALDAKHRVKHHAVISVGSLTSSIVHPREVFRFAVRTSAAAVLCLHNHPSGDPEPSAEDLEVTRRLAAAGRTLGIALLDHVVIGDGVFVSLRERISW